MDFLNILTEEEKIVARKVRFCRSFWQERIGLRFCGDPEGGAYFPTGGSVDMLFCRVPLRIIWLTKDNEYISETLAFPWHPLYRSPKGTGRILELAIDNAFKFKPKQRLTIKLF